MYMDAALAFIINLASSDMIIIALIGLLLFGKRLPEVGKSLGKTVIEFKKGLRGIEDEIERATQEPSPTTERPMLTESSTSVHTTPSPTEAYQEPVAVETHSEPTAVEAHHEPLAPLHEAHESPAAAHEAR